MPAHLIVEDGPLAGQVLEFKDKDEWIIGRDPELADLVLEDSTVSREHLLCQKTDDGIVIKNLSTINPTVVNEMIVDEPMLLTEGDRLQIGHNSLLFSEEEFSSEVLEETEKENTFIDEIEEEEEEVNPYDTIFEDVDDQQSLPVQLIGETPLLLKVLSGPNAGAEIGVEKSRSYIVGKDPNSCDIVFQDLSVSKNHARITVEADGKCFIEDLDSKNGTLVNNKRVEGKIEVAPQDTLTLGTTNMLLIDKESALETIYSPIEEEEIEEEEAEVITEEDWKKRLIPKKYLYLASSAAVIVFIVFLSFFSLFKGSEMIVSWEDNTKDVQNFFKAYPGIVYNYNASTETIFLSGHVLTPVQMQELIYNLEHLPYIRGIENSVIVDQIVWSNLNSLISSNANWEAVRVTSTAPGAFVLTGYVNSIEESENLTNFVHVNFPYNDQLTNNVIVEQILNAEVQTMLQQMGFVTMSFQMANGELILAGSYAKKDQKSLNKLIETLENTPGIASVRNLGVATSGSTPRIDLSQKYQVTGFANTNHTTVSVVINGRIFNVGESLDGMEITGLENDAVLLERGALRYRITFNL